MAQKAIDDIKGETKVISSAYIQEVVAKYYDISVDDLKGQKRSNDVVFPRQIAMYLCRNVAQMSMPQIGRDFGNRDHSTVMYACDKIEKEIKKNETTKLIVESVKNLLLSNK
jgi:chromosomal replication initiator protein